MTEALMWISNPSLRHVHGR